MVGEQWWLWCEPGGACNEGERSREEPPQKEGTAGWTEASRISSRVFHFPSRYHQTNLAYLGLCLYPGHTAGACKNATNPKSVCSLKGCQKHHHPSLHGAKDKNMTSVNILRATSMREVDTDDISDVRSPTSVTRFEHDVERAFIEVNFMEDGTSEMYDTFGKKEVDERVRELNQGEKAVREHRLEGDRVLMVAQSVPMKYGIAGVGRHIL